MHVEEEGKNVNEPDFCALGDPKMFVIYSTKPLVPQTQIYFIYQDVTNIYFKEADK